MKSHFQFSKQERSGIFLLLLLIFALLSVYLFVDFSNDDVLVDEKQLEVFRKEVDSLRLVEIENSKTKIYPFNPNFITDYKGYTLGMSNEEIDRLLDFRKKNQWINSASQFQDVTKVSDSLLDSISRYFKFPDWINNSKPETNSYPRFYSNDNKPKTYAQKRDLNKATSSQLQQVSGIGEVLSQRIVTYRDSHKGGFISDVQLFEVYGLSPEVIERLTNEFTVKTPRAVKKINLNTATRDELVTIQYIDYEIAHNIIEYRTLIEGFKSLDDLTKVEDFPIKKLEIIKLYLQKI